MPAANKTQKIPPQHQQSQPGSQSAMKPEPVSIRADYRGSLRLHNRVALISGGDSGIGRAVALHFAREDASVAFIYKNEHEDAAATVDAIERDGARALAIAGDTRDKAFCEDAVQQVLEKFGGLDILVNNAAEQHPQKELTDISEEQLRDTFATNIFGYFFLTQAALPHLKEGSVIINTGSVTSFRGSARLMDYAATKGAIQAFTFSLAQALAKRGIRVNEVAPGPIWTPLIPSSFSAEEVASFGTDTLMGRAGQPAEVAPAYVYLASADSAYVTGQVIHVNGGGYIGV
ncbi:MAG TPA: SDR family oxidoreductase [Dongiaceae bacterium]|nr:SDR family oxidoreductase [Dongiaceae bacterium]